MPPTLKLPPRQAAPNLGESECGNILTRLIYHPIAGLVYQARYRMALDLLIRSGPVKRLLEVGCGAGLLLPSLAALDAPVVAIDTHDQQGSVRQMVSALGVERIALGQADIRQLPFTQESFSHIVCVSVLDHVRELEAAFRELRRVTRKGGWLIVGGPIRNWATRLLFASVGYCDTDIHPSSHRDILRAAKPFWELKRLQLLPPGFPLSLSLYLTAQFLARPRPAWLRDLG